MSVLLGEGPIGQSSAMKDLPTCGPQNPNQVRMPQQVRSFVEHACCKTCALKSQVLAIGKAAQKLHHPSPIN
eukprot:2603489-Amphidinium_carterae.1